jgi:hypothetical protein
MEQSKEVIQLDSVSTNTASKLEKYQENITPIDISRRGSTGVFADKKLTFAEKNALKLK